MTDPRDAPPHGGPRRRVPPLAWIILALLLLIVVIAVSQCEAIRDTPSGGEMPTSDLEDPAEAIMPADPATQPAPAN